MSIPTQMSLAEFIASEPDLHFTSGPPIVCPALTEVSNSLPRDSRRWPRNELRVAPVWPSSSKIECLRRSRQV